MDRRNSLLGDDSKVFAHGVNKGAFTLAGVAREEEIFTIINDGLHESGRLVAGCYFEDTLVRCESS